MKIRSFVKREYLVLTLIVFFCVRRKTIRFLSKQIYAIFADRV